jgi:hypothetical protein
MIIRSDINCLCRSQCFVSLLLILIICTPITTVVFIPNEAAAQQLTKTPQYTTLVQQQLGTLPNSTSTSEQLVAKSSSSDDLTAIGKIGEITLKGDPRSIGINPKTNLIYASQSLERPPYTVITVIDGKTNSEEY